MDALRETRRRRRAPTRNANLRRSWLGDGAHQNRGRESKTRRNGRKMCGERGREMSLSLSLSENEHRRRDGFRVTGQRRQPAPASHSGAYHMDKRVTYTLKIPSSFRLLIRTPCRDRAERGSRHQRFRSSSSQRPPPSSPGPSTSPCLPTSPPCVLLVFSYL